MEKKTLFIMIALIIVIFICLGAVMFFVLDEDNDEDTGGTDNRGNLEWYPPYIYPSPWCLNISERGYDIMKIGPFVDKEYHDGFPGINVTFHLKDKNITEYTGTNGYAVFNITYPVEYGRCNLTFSHGSKTVWKEIYFEVIKD